MSWNVPLLINNLEYRLGTTFTTNYIDATGGEFVNLYAENLTADTIVSNTLVANITATSGEFLDLVVSDSATFGNLNVSGNATFNQVSVSGLSVINNLSSSNLSVSGNTTFNSVSASGLSVVNNLTVSGLFATSVSGPWVSQDINATSTNTVPSSKTLSDYSVVVNNLIETQLQPLNKATAIQVPTTSDFTIGSGGSFATLQDALASPLVKNGSVLRILENTTLDISANLIITKQVVIWGENRDTCIIRNATGSPSLTFLLTVQADYVMFNNLTINFTSTISDNFALTFTNSSGGNVVNPIVANCRVIYNKFGIVMRGLNWVVANCLFETQSAGTTRRAISIYRSAGNSFVYKNTFNQTIDTANRLIHVLETSVADTKLGTINIIGNTSTGVAIQFVNVESFRGNTNGLTYIIKDNVMNESNAFVVLFGGSFVNAYNNIKDVFILNNRFTNRHTTSPFGGKGCLSLDTSVVGRSSSLPVFAFNNVATIDQFYRAGWGLAANATGVQVGITTAGAAAYVSAGYNPVAFVDANVSASLLPSVPTEFNPDENEITIIRQNYIDLSTLSTTLGNYSTLNYVNGTFNNYALNATLANYPTNNFLTSTLGNYSTLNYVNGTFNNYALNATLANYPTNNFLTSTLGNYSTLNYVNGTFNNYALNATLANYSTNSALTTTLGNYGTLSYINNTFNNYPTNTQLSTTLGNYGTLSYINNTFNNYPTNTQLSTTLGNYATLQFLSATLANYSQGAGGSTFETFMESQVGSNLRNDTYIKDIKPTGVLTNSYSGIVHSVRLLQLTDVNNDPINAYIVICLEYTNINKTAVRGAIYDASAGTLISTTSPISISNSAYNNLYGQYTDTSTNGLTEFLIDYTGSNTRTILFYNEFGSYDWDPSIQSAPIIPTVYSNWISNVYINNDNVSRRVLSNINENTLQFYTKSSSILIDQITAITYNNLPTLSGNYLALTGGTLTGDLVGTTGSFSNLYSTNFKITSSPSVAPLNNGMKFDATDNTALYVYANNVPESKIRFQANNQEVALMDDGGLTLVSGGGNTTLHLESGASQQSRIHFGNSTSRNRGRIHYENSTNNMNFHVNNNNQPALTITANGNVGIGTTTPNNLLTINGNNATVEINGGTGGATLEIGGNSGGIIDIKRPFSDDYDMRIGTLTNNGGIIDIAGTGSLNLRTGSADRLTITANGNVGIGTTNPNSLLSVGGDGVNGSGLINGISMKVNSSSTADRRNFSVGQGDNANVFLNWTHSSITANAYAVLETWSNSNPLILQSTSGRVGIGTTTPTTKFEINAASTPLGAIIMNKPTSIATDGSRYIGFQTKNFLKWNIGINEDETGVGNGGNMLSIYSYNNTGIFIRDVMNLTRDGNVGIGTNTPTNRLQIVGRFRIDALSNGDSASVIEMRNFGGSSNFFFNDSSGNYIIDPVGNVGIDITPTQKLHVNGNVLANNVPVPSDQRIKENIVDAITEDNLNHILALQVKHYDYTENFVKYCNKDDTSNYGFIAQQVEQVIPNAVKTIPFSIQKSNRDGTYETIEHFDDFKIVQKELIFTEAVGAIQELYKIIQLQKTHIEQLEQRISNLETI
jgi:hypothetical protein